MHIKSFNGQLSERDLLCRRFAQAGEGLQGGQAEKRLMGCSGYTSTPTVDSQFPTSPWRTSTALGFSYERDSQLGGGRQTDGTSSGHAGGQSRRNPLTPLLVWAIRDALALRVARPQGCR